MTGSVVSDWGASNNYVEGVRNGSHMEMPTTRGGLDLELLEAVKSGRLSEEKLDRRVDEILDVTLPVTQAVKGLDRAHMKLPRSQVDLPEAVSAVNPNVVAVMSAGSPVEMPWLDKCKALIHGYLCGQAGAGAILQAILGEINPSGKLAESYPLKYEDAPPAPAIK